MTTAYLNGEFLPLDQARVPAMDRGFLFGDGVYEIIPVYAGKLFRCAQHLQRLRRSLHAIELNLDLDDVQIEALLADLVMRNGSGDQSAYIQITRGVAPVRDHSFPLHIEPTVFAYTAPLYSKTIAELAVGMRAITVPDLRWQRCDIKAITLLANVLARQSAIAKGCQEAILINDGLAIEGSAMNLFIVKDGKIITPPLSNHILGGITRDLVLELARAHSFPVAETDIPEKQLWEADEIWLTSSNREIVPVIELDGKKISNGKAGPVWLKMAQSYHDFKESMYTP